MSVMAETSQSAMGPYVAMAAVEFASKAWTAVFSSVVSVNVVGGGGSESGGGGGDGGLVKARSTGKNCGGTALKRTRWQVGESELVFNESWGWFTVFVA